MELFKGKFERYFRALSYLVAACGLFALYFSGGVGVFITSLFVGVIVLAAWLEDSKWQLSERTGVILTILVVPVFFVEWRFELFGAPDGKTIIAGGLARLILFLCAVKLLQKKTDRDWIFIYIIAFFEMLLAAGLSISPLFLVTLFAYLIFTLSAIIAFEIRRTSREVSAKKTGKKPVPGDQYRSPEIRGGRTARLPLVTVFLLVFITLFAVPTFFLLPRVGGAGIGGSLTGGRNLTGFSDSVRLGEIGQLKLSDEPVMRVRIEVPETGRPEEIYWRGVALDSFDNRRWSKSRINRLERVIPGSNGFFPLNFEERMTGNIVQTFYLEPIGSPTLFAMARPLSLRGNFDIVRKGPDDSLKSTRVGFQRVTYRVHSNRSVPAAGVLRKDAGVYRSGSASYLRLPDNFDRRIGELAATVSERAGAKNVYDKARSIESFLKNNFRYSLEMKAGGDQPVADFLFNVRAGHCEYFSTAMAVMLRTQGIASRVVNGFQQGEYNQTADLYIVRQKDAHSWVEVYFPESKSWVAFDPTPGEGLSNYAGPVTLAGRLRNYLEAIESVWIEYFVSYDSQGQQSMFQSARNGLSQYREFASEWLEAIRIRASKWWSEVRGDEGFGASIRAVLFGAGYAAAGVFGFLFLVWLARRFSRIGLWKKLGSWFRRKNDAVIVEFYERLQKILASRGYTRPLGQTPLEFAGETGIPEAVGITEQYNRVRFGEKRLSGRELKEIENWLERLDSAR